MSQLDDENQRAQGAWSTNARFNNPSTVHLGESEDRSGEIVTTYSVKVPRYLTPYSRTTAATARMKVGDVLSDSVRRSSRPRSRARLFACTSRS